MKKQLRVGAIVRNKRSGRLGIVRRITEDGSIQVQEKPNVICTHDSEKILERVAQMDLSKGGCEDDK